MVNVVLHALQYRDTGLMQTGSEALLCCLQVPEAEYDETVNKAAALGRAIDLAEQAFLDDE